MRSLYFLFFILILGFSSCTGCNDEVISDTTEPQAIQTPHANRERLSDEQIEKLEDKLQEFFFLLGEGRFKEHLSMMYPSIWDVDSDIDTYVDILQEVSDGGVINYADENKLNYVSPIVLDTISGKKLVFIEFQSKMRIYVDEKAYKNGLSLEGSIRTRYGSNNYQWVEEERTYYIDSPSKMYVFINEDRTDFSFLNEQYIQSPKLSGILGYYTVKELKTIDKERP